MLAAIGVIGATIVRLGRQLAIGGFEIYMTTETAQDLTQDTRVFVRGLQVGRIREISPVVDQATNQLTFVARLEINTSFPDGSNVPLPRETAALISKTTPIAAPVVELVIPVEFDPTSMLQPGDTIKSTRRQEALDVLSDVAEDITAEIFETVRATRAVLEASLEAVDLVQQQVNRTVPQVDSIINLVTLNLEQTYSILDDVRPRVGIIQDTVLAALSDTRRLLLGFDSLRTLAQTLAIDNTDAVNEIIEQM
ncbi:MAG: MlaD family protein, partial [Gemmatimonadales bacterium]